MYVCVPEATVKIGYFIGMGVWPEIKKTYLTKFSRTLHLNKFSKIYFGLYLHTVTDRVMISSPKIQKDCFLSFT